MAAKDECWNIGSNDNKKVDIYDDKINPLIEIFSSAVASEIATENKNTSLNDDSNQTSSNSDIENENPQDEISSPLHIIDDVRRNASSYDSRPKTLDANTENSEVPSLSSIEGDIMLDSKNNNPICTYEGIDCDNDQSLVETVNAIPKLEMTHKLKEFNKKQKKLSTNVSKTISVIKEEEHSSEDFFETGQTEENLKQNVQLESNIENGSSLNSYEDNDAIDSSFLVGIENVEKTILNCQFKDEENFEDENNKTIKSYTLKTENQLFNDAKKLSIGRNSISPSYKKTSRVSEDNGRDRRVSFPEDRSRLITSYLEPANPWGKMNYEDTEQIGNAYRLSCSRHGTYPLPIVLQQIAALPLSFGGRIECLSLRNQPLDFGQIECLEEIFRRVQFKSLDFEACGLDDDSALSLLDMIDFYDSATQLNLSCNSKISERGWRGCARVLKRSSSIQFLDIHNTNLNENYVPFFAKALRQSNYLETLHLENCNLSGRPLFTLAWGFENDTISELYLADNRLGVNDSIILGNLLRNSKSLKLFDLRNNNIQDDGCAHLCDGIIEHQKGEDFLINEDSSISNRKKGLATFVLWNNHLTVSSITHISAMLQSNFSIQMLNLGRNNVTSDGVLQMKNSLIRNRSLSSLGLQCTRIGNEGVVAIAEYVADNTAIKRIDLRENNIQLAGLMALYQSLRVNKTIIQLNLSPNPNNEISQQNTSEHGDLHHKIKELCQANQTELHIKNGKQNNQKGSEAGSRNSVDESLRKVSLTCESRTYTPAVQIGSINLTSESRRYKSPDPSPSASPCPSPCLSPLPSPIKSRFRVNKVSENLGKNSMDSNILSTSAPTVITDFNPTPIINSTGNFSNRFKTGGRFTVTKVSDNYGNLTSNRVMSYPSLIIPEIKDRKGPIIVVSSPNKPVHGFNIACNALVAKDARKDDNKIVEAVIDISKTNIGTFNSSKNEKNESELVSAQPSEMKVNKFTSPLIKAPLACSEAESLDESDSDEESEVATQSSDSTHSDEVRISMEASVAMAAWEPAKKEPIHLADSTEIKELANVEVSRVE